jgi:hypothetical protein
MLCSRAGERRRPDNPFCFITAPTWDLVTRDLGLWEVTGRAYRERERERERGEAVIKRTYTVLTLHRSYFARYQCAVPVWNLDTDYSFKVGFAILSSNCEGYCHLSGCGTV